LSGCESWVKKILVNFALKINAKLSKVIPYEDSSDFNVKIGVTPSTI
jgi:hypothetical protein